MARRGSSTACAANLSDDGASFAAAAAAIGTAVSTVRTSSGDVRIPWGARGAHRRYRKAPRTRR